MYAINFVLPVVIVITRSFPCVRIVVIGLWNNFLSFCDNCLDKLRPSLLSGWGLFVFPLILQIFFLSPYIPSIFYLNWTCKPKNYASPYHETGGGADKSGGKYGKNEFVQKWRPFFWQATNSDFLISSGTKFFTEIPSICFWKSQTAPPFWLSLNSLASLSDGKWKLK